MPGHTVALLRVASIDECDDVRRRFGFSRQWKDPLDCVFNVLVSAAPVRCLVHAAVLTTVRYPEPKSPLTITLPKTPSTTAR